MSVCGLKSRKGHSVVEILVVLGLLSLFVSIVFPAVQRAREAAARARCQLNLKELGLAVHQYHDSFERFPSIALLLESGNPPSPSLLNWPVVLLPYIEQEPLWNSAMAACKVNSLTFMNPPHVGLATVIPVYMCPSDVRLSHPFPDRNGITAAYTSYIGVGGSLGGDGIFVLRPVLRFASVSDGLSNTAMVGERPPPGTLQAGWWYSLMALGAWADSHQRGPDSSLLAAYRGTPSPCTGAVKFGPGEIDNACDRFHFWSMHPGGANFLFADGAVHFLAYSASSVLPALATRAGGEAVEIPE